MFVLLASFLASYSQTPTYSKDIATIIYKNCTPCHRNGEIAPIPFTKYSEVVPYGGFIEYVTRIKYMPPWMPDKNYSHFVGERGLTNTEIQKIKDWVTAGMPRGDSTLEPPLPSFPQGSQVGVPDTVIPMAKAYKLNPNGKDDYRVFVLPSGLSQDKDVSAIEFRPGNSKVVHHALIAFENQGQARILDAQDSVYGYSSFGGFGVTTLGEFAGYVPGLIPIKYPQGTGKKVNANSDYLVQVHYAPTTTAQSDSSKLNIFYSKGLVSRQVLKYTVSPYDLPGGPNSFFIPANTVKSFKASLPIPVDVSLMTVIPHMHYVGKSWKIYAVKSNGDSIPIVKINEWDFHWQGAYTFNNLLKIPAGSTIYAEATYDNTNGNTHNPNSPPRLMTWGENTSDEMFLAYLFYLPYRNGDESIALSSSELPYIPNQNGIKLYPLYPNPVKDEMNIPFSVENNMKLTFTCYDILGKQVFFEQKNFSKGRYNQEFSTNDIANGMYFLKVSNGTEQKVHKFFVVH